MTKSKMLASGRLSELFGEKAVNMDKFSLTIGYKRAA
jgi:acyl-homoserine lactone acylase PvdQ